MNAYRIEKGVPMPAIRRSNEAEFPFRELQIGESFEVPAAKAGKTGVRLSTAAQNCRRYTGRRFAIRKINGRTFRAWRVA